MNNEMTHFDKAIKWIHNNTIDNKGIAVTSKQQVVYP